MKEVIFFDNFKPLSRLAILKKEEVVRYFVIDHNIGTDSVIEVLRQDKKFSEINSDLLNNFRRGFSEKFINFIADLNKTNRSLFWWALNFTNKNPISTPLCDEVFQVLSIVHLIQNKSIECLLVATNNVHIVKQFSQYAAQHRIKTVDRLSIKIDVRETIMKYTPVGVVYAFLRMAVCAIYAKLFCPVKPDRNKKQIAVFSILSPKSFDKNGRYCDVYFGKFLDYLCEKGHDFISVVIARPREYRKVLQKAWMQEKSLCIFPVEYFLSIKDLLTCFWQGLIKYFSSVQIQGNALIDDVDFAYLVKKNIRRDYRSPFFFDNLRIYHATRSFAKRVSLDKFFYPFENRPFEKMIVLGLKNVSNANIMGYQHASISLRHTNFLFAEDEYTFTPLPGSIITMGGVTKNILEKYGRFPGNLMKSGCALRQARFLGELKPKKDEIKNIFIALATNIEEYVKVIRFLNAVLEGNDFYNIWIRPHPAFSLEEALKLAGTVKFKFYKADKETLDDCYAWADVVLYVHSTLSIEALARGIPVVNLKIDSSLNPDPLFDFNDFKWIAEDPSWLIPTLRNIGGLNSEEFVQRRQKGAEYASNYFGECTMNVLDSFME